MPGKRIFKLIGGPNQNQAVPEGLKLLTERFPDRLWLSFPERLTHCSTTLGKRRGRLVLCGEASLVRLFDFCRGPAQRPARVTAIPRRALLPRQPKSNSQRLDSLFSQARHSRIRWHR